ncbi:MAG: T9SS type A sorting domain-containing protein [Ignavibacteria bacterium]|nr:T9SS type A sorting domain-containing protein [Ignavibacteria bacterium]
MKWKILLIFVAMLFSQNIFSQSITWQRTYEKNSMWVGNDACQTIDGNFVIAGSTIISGIGTSIMAMKINEYGDTIWTRTILSYPNEVTEGNCVTPTGDGGIVISGNNDSIYSCKLDVNGNLIWYKNYLPLSSNIRDIKVTTDKGYIICGTSSYPPYQGTAIKIDSSGNLMWVKLFSSTFLKSFYSVTLNGTGYILTGIESSFLGDRNQLIIVSLSSNGDSLWQKNYYVKNNAASGREIIKTGQSLYIGGGTVDSDKAQLCFMKTDLNGDSIYTRTFPVNGRHERFGSFSVINNNRFVFCYERDSISTLYNGIGIISDSIGNITKKAVFTNSNFRWGSLRAITPISNGDIFFAGTAQLLPSYARVVYCVRTDSMLNTPVYIGINNHSEIIPKNFKLYQNYPNPFNPNTTITFSLAKSGVVKIKIFDITGKVLEIRTGKFYNAGNHKFDFTANNLSSGIYFYQLSIDGVIVDTKKMCLLK